MCAAERRTRARRGLAVAVPVALAGLLAIAATATPPGRTPGPPATPRLRHVYPNTLPPGAGHDIAGRACLLCHSATLITQQHKDSTAWAKTLGTMAGWGAPFDSTERDTLRGWLVQEFGPKR